MGTIQSQHCGRGYLVTFGTYKFILSSNGNCKEHLAWTPKV